MVVEDVCEFSEMWSLILHLDLEVDGGADDEEADKIEGDILPSLLLSHFDLQI